jgi:putative membrane protein
MMMYWGSGMGGWGMLLVTVSNLLFVGLLIAGAPALIRYASRSARQDSAADPAPAQWVLADRFARSEIDEDEYERRLGVLTTTPGRRPAG